MIPRSYAGSPEDENPDKDMIRSDIYRQIDTLTVGVYVMGPYSFLSALSGYTGVLSSNKKSYLKSSYSDRDFIKALKNKRKYDYFVKYADIDEENNNIVKTLAMYHRDMKTYNQLQFNNKYIPSLAWFICPFIDVAPFLNSETYWKAMGEYNIFDYYHSQFYNYIFTNNQKTFIERIWNGFKNTPVTNFQETSYNFLIESLRRLKCKIRYFDGLLSIIGADNLNTLLKGDLIEYSSSVNELILNISEAHRFDILKQHNIKLNDKSIIVYSLKALDGEVLDYLLQDMKIEDVKLPYKILDSQDKVLIIPVEEETKLTPKEEETIRDFLDHISKIQHLDLYYRNKGKIKIGNTEFYYIVKTNFIKELKYLLLS